MVPETELMSGEQLSADDAWHTARRYGLRHLIVTAFVRFRYGDGFSHARAFALQLALAAVPLVIAGAGFATALGVRVVRRGGRPHGRGGVAGQQRLAAAEVIEGGRTDEGSERGEVVVVLGLVTAFAAATSAFAQLERGANRIYGTKRDRPALRKYGRAAVLTATAGVAMAVGPAADRGRRAVRRGDGGRSTTGATPWRTSGTSCAGLSGWLRWSSRSRGCSGTPRAGASPG